VRSLAAEPALTASRLAGDLPISRQAVAKHLAVLADAGLVARRKEGTRVYYGIADSRVFELCERVCGSLHAQLAALAELTRT
jgi:DNA-binding transcriptional ArsR family regulator